MEGPDGLLAKSADRSEGDVPESLAYHTWLVLSRLADQFLLRPDLPVQTGEPRLWHRMYWACFLHDFGKAARGFQAVLRGGEPWPQRHEVLSLAFTDWLFPRGHEDREWVVAAIASHHKEADILYERYLGGTDTAAEALAGLGAELNQQSITWLWRWLAACGPTWIDLLGLSEHVEALLPPPLTEAVERVSVEAIRNALKGFTNLSEDIRWDSYSFTERERAGILYRGLILASDHSASAHAPHFRPLTLTRETGRGLLTEADLRDHQRAAGQVPAGSAILEAPTGSGKTEAALLWAACQLNYAPAARLFYALPYQASMNAMHDRLMKKHSLSGDEISLQHGRALQSLYFRLMDGNEAADQKALMEQARDKQEVANLGIPPIRIFSPYQMLKAAYSLKGFESQLLDYYGGLFIFDEIHAYEPGRLAMIVALVGWLRKYFDARFLVMTATLPPPVRQALSEALPSCASIVASPEVYEASKRHILHLLPGDLFDEAIMAQISADVRAGKSVLVTLTTVQRAMDFYGQFDDTLVERILIHGRFNARDRINKEEDIKKYTGTGSRERRPVLVIATQVVEVSLDISLDTLYSDPAPLDALLQRFGRVNRAQPIIGLRPVHVCEYFEISRKKAFGVYDAALVQGALDALKALNGRAIDEAQIGTLLDQVYQGDVLRNWQQQYRQAAINFAAILDGIRPFHSADRELTRKFYELFDGVEVLPVSLETEYDQLGRDEGLVAASRLMVPMSFGQYKSLENRGIGWLDEKYRRNVHMLNDSAAPYRPAMGLDLAALRAAADAEEAESEDY